MYVFPSKPNWKSVANNIIDLTVTICDFRQRNAVKRGTVATVKSVGLSLCLSIFHSRESRLRGLRYRHTFAPYDREMFRNRRSRSHIGLEKFFEGLGFGPQRLVYIPV